MIIVCCKCDRIIGAVTDDRIPENIAIECIECLDEQAKKQVEALRESPWRD